MKALVACLCVHTATGFAPSAHLFSPFSAPVVAHANRPGTTVMSAEFTPGETCSGERVVVVGASGYIGKAVVRESVRRGYPTKAVVRDATTAASDPKLSGATIAQADVCVPSSLTLAGAPFEKGSVDVVISCLASRTGSKKDSFAIDYQATLNCLEAAREAGARHFVLLSAFCVKSAERRDPYALQFQYAKKDMEEALRAQPDVSYSIIRPTAFFKSVSGQLEVVNGGAPFVYFDLGNGKSATCNPIAEADLAAALVDTIADESKKNALWNLGGPDDGMSMQQQGRILADVLGKEEAKLFGVPIGIFDFIINGLQVRQKLLHAIAHSSEDALRKTATSAHAHTATYICTRLGAHLGTTTTHCLARP
jgi:divinyl chlorophyllide a 8-vinyl-reductase